MRKMVTIFVLMIMASFTVSSQDLSVQYEELTAPDFVNAVEKSGSTAIIPLGILEKHGTHLPLGTDIFLSRAISNQAAGEEYTIVFPLYYFGQIFEARHQPGTISYSKDLMWNILQETCDELSRNGIKKIILVNGHGGNNYFLPFFCQEQLAEQKDYVVVWFRPEEGRELTEKIRALRNTTTGGHADEEETSMMLVAREDLVHADRATQQSGEDLERLKELPFGYTGIWWYASYPNHYAGDGSTPNKEIGKLIIDNAAGQLAELVRYLKQHDTVKELQDRFYGESEEPLKWKQ
ncbi:creatininase family protein [Bacteroidota bacterium]